MTEVVSTRITDDMAKDLEEIEKDEKSDRATVVRKLLSKAITDWKLQKALMLYRGGKVSLRKAAQIANISLWEMMEIVKEQKVPLQYDYEDFRADFEAALKEN
jgi:predicted HTH domain antitoxin